MTDYEDPRGERHGHLRKWADEHQYDAEPQPGATPNNGVMPSVHLLHMQDDPLGVLAAQNGIYRGDVIRSLPEVTDDMRRQALDDMMKTTLQSPLEAIKMHFVFEGVDRAFTHQLVRQRTANYGQESLRFSVVGPLIDATTLPPELHGTELSAGLQHAPFVSFQELTDSQAFSYAKQDDRNRAVWDWCIMNIDMAYHYLVEHGLAAEEARGLLPHATATRIHYQTDLRALMKVMGERLCTQAQFHWRLVAAQVRASIRDYTPDFSWAEPGDVPQSVTDGEAARMVFNWERANRWQFELIADSGIFRPVCYQTGHCMFQASADRGCTIRPRVEEFAKHGIPSDQWDVGIGKPSFHESGIQNIHPEEWVLNPAAARGQ